MPAADPTASFETAARHLFNHLNDANKLRANPLVSRLFGSDKSPAKDRLALGTIRAVAMRGAERYSHKDVIAVLGPEAARRRHTIALDHLLGGDSLDAIASKFRISNRQCYRERLAVVRDIARFIGDCDLDQPRITSLFARDEELFLNRGDSFAELGELERALHEYDTVVRSGASPDAKVDALCRSADVLLRHDRYSESEAILENAVAIAGTLEGSAKSVGLAHIALMRARISWLTAGYEPNLRHLEDALRFLTPVLSLKGERIATLYLRTNLEFCDRYNTFGDFALAHEHLLQAETALTWFDVPPALRFDTMMMSFRLGGKDSSFEGVTTRRMIRYDALVALSDIARRLGSTRRSVDLAHTLVHYNFDAGNVDEAAEWAERSLRLARPFPERGLYAQASLTVVDYLAITPRWHLCSSLLESTDGAFHTGSPDWLLQQGLWSSVALRAKRNEEALRRATLVADATASMHNVRFESAARTTMALAAHALGQRATALEQIHAALRAVDQFGTPWTQAQAYAAAAKITNSRRYRKKADAMALELGRG